MLWTWESLIQNLTLLWTKRLTQRYLRPLKSKKKKRKERKIKTFNLHVFSIFIISISLISKILPFKLQTNCSLFKSILSLFSAIYENYKYVSRHIRDNNNTKLHSQGKPCLQWSLMDNKGNTALMFLVKEFNTTLRCVTTMIFLSGSIKWSS